MSRIYEHRKGGRYRLLKRGTNEADQTPVVIYQSLQDGRVWVRPASEFDDGRFTVIEDTPDLRIEIWGVSLISGQDVHVCDVYSAEDGQKIMNALRDGKTVSVEGATVHAYHFASLRAKPVELRKIGYSTPIGGQTRG